MDKNKTLTEAANDLIEHAMEHGIPGRMIPFVEALRVAKNERKAESDAARQEIASLKAQHEGGKSEALADLAYAHGMATGWNLCIADKHDEFARIRSMRSSQAISTIEAPQPAAQAQAARWPLGQQITDEMRDAAEKVFFAPATSNYELPQQMLDAMLAAAPSRHSRPTRSQTMKDTFRGDTAALIRNIDVLLEMDAAGALVPHGVGGHARCLLEAASVRLAAVAKPAARGAALATLKHPAVKPNMLVNGGALKLALNVLRRAGKNEVADELEATAQAAPAVPAIGQTLSWEPTYREDFLQLAQKCGAVITGKPDASEAITVVFSVEAWRAFDLATAQAAPVDAAVQEDAERWQFFAEYLVSTRTDLDDEIVGCDSVQKMARVLDAAIAAQKETND